MPKNGVRQFHAARYTYSAWFDSLSKRIVWPPTGTDVQHGRFSVARRTPYLGDAGLLRRRMARSLHGRYVLFSATQRSSIKAPAGVNQSHSQPRRLKQLSPSRVVGAYSTNTLFYNTYISIRIQITIANRVLFGTLT